MERIVAADLRDPIGLVTPADGDTNASASSPIVSDVGGHRRLLEDFLRAIDETASRFAMDLRDGGASEDRGDLRIVAERAAGEFW